MKDRPTTDQICADVYFQLQKTAYYDGFSSHGLDLCKISRQEDKFATTLLSRISENETTELSFIAKNEAIKPLADLFYDAYQQSGRSDYEEAGIGFPMFYIKNEDHPLAKLAAPLFIWRVDFRPDYADKWHLNIKRGDVLPNKLLLAFFTEKYGIDLAEKFDKCLEKKGDLGEAIYHLCYELIVQLDLKDQRSTTTILPSPSSIDNTRGTIHWSGVLNLFGIQQTHLLAQAKNIKKPSWQSIETPSWSHNYGIFPTDPMQELVMQYFQTHNLIVDGEPGTGVLQTAANIAVNCLANEKNVLIVSRKPALLGAIRRHLASRNLDQYALNLFTNHTPDRQAILNETPKHDREQYNLNLQKALRNQTTLADQYNATTQPIFGKYTWTNVVGLFLAANGKEPSALLNSHLNFSDYQWSYKVFNSFSEKVAQGVDLFENIGTTEHPLNKLNSILFLEYNPAQSLRRINESVRQLKEKAHNLQQKYINKLHTYTVKLTHYYNDGLKDFQKKSDVLLELIGDLDSEHGTRGIKTGMLSTGKLKLSGIFSRSAKNILERQKRVKADYQFMRAKFSENHFFNYTFPTYTGSEKIPEIQASVQAFRTALQEFQQTVPQLIQDNLDSLSGTHQVAAMGYEATVRSLDNELRAFLRSVNQTRLFEEEITATAHPTREQQNQLEQVVNQLDAINFNLRDFDNFHAWQKYWLQLSHSEQKVVLALTRVKPNDWVAAFQSWYLQQFLSQYHHEGIPEDDQHYQRFLMALDGFKEQFPAQIIAQQKKRQTRSPRLKPDLFTNANQDFSAIQFLQKNTSEVAKVTEQYPVLLTTPELAIEWIDGTQNIFDAILVLGIDELKFSNYFPLLNMAPRVIGFTSSRNGFQTTDYTLLDSLIDQDTQEINLLYHHRPGPAAITDLCYEKFTAVRDLHFYNKTKNKNALVNLPLDLSYRSDQNIKMHYGSVLEKILNEIKPTCKGYQYPDLRIVVEEKDLRDFLFYRLYHKRVGHTAMADQLQKLFPNGIKIYPPENQADGTTDYLLYIQSPGSPYRGTRILQNHLISTGQKVFFIHSDQVPSYGSYTDEQLLVKKRYRRNIQCDYFIDEVVESLSNHLHPAQLVKHAWINELYVPLLIKPDDKNAAPIAVIIDGIGDRRGALALNWEREYRALLTFYGLEYVYVWSADWWKNESDAVALLVNKIAERTAQYVG